MNKINIGVRNAKVAWWWCWCKISEPKWLSFWSSAGIAQSTRLLPKVENDKSFFTSPHQTPFTHIWTLTHPPQTLIPIATKLACLPLHPNVPPNACVAFTISMLSWANFRDVFWLNFIWILVLLSPNNFYICLTRYVTWNIVRDCNLSIEQLLSFVPNTRGIVVFPILFTNTLQAFKFYKIKNS